MTVTSQTHAANIGPPPMHCPDCGAPMRLLSLTPTSKGKIADELAYRCEACKIELKRMTKRPMQAAE